MEKIKEVSLSNHEYGRVQIIMPEKSMTIKITKNHTIRDTTPNMIIPTYKDDWQK